MSEQKAIHLEAMDERQTDHLLGELATRSSPEGEYEIRYADDYVMEMPQSGERFVGRENMRVRDICLDVRTLRLAVRTSVFHAGRIR